MNIVDKNASCDNPMLRAFIARVLTRCGIIPKQVVIDDMDLSRIYLYIDDEEYNIRTWNIYETKKCVVVEWSLIVFDNDNHEYIDTIGYGTSRLRIAHYFPDKTPN